MDNMIADALANWLQQACPPSVVREVEASGDASLLWQQLQESGFADAMLPEEEGGGGLDLAQAQALFALCGAHAVPLPLAETMLARALLAKAGVESPSGSILLGEVTREKEGSYRCAHALYGRIASHALVSDGQQTRLLDCSSAKRQDSVFALDATLTWPQAVWQAGILLPQDLNLRSLQACILSAQLAAAMDPVFRRTLQYANERQQFGRPIGKFQAIQHQIGVMSEHCFAAGMAARLACSGAALIPDAARVAVAKARCSEAATEIAALAHSIHGAIGFTAEFDLQLYTRRLHLWRRAAGSESYWQQWLGDELVWRKSGPMLDVLRELSDLPTPNPA